MSLTLTLSVDRHFHHAYAATLFSFLSAQLLKAQAITQTGIAAASQPLSTAAATITSRPHFAISPHVLTRPLLVFRWMASFGYAECWWFVWTVYTTVGFGDWTPITPFGRIMAVNMTFCARRRQQTFFSPDVMGVCFAGYQQRCRPHAHCFAHQQARMFDVNTPR